MADNKPASYRAAMGGRFAGILSWQDFAKLWARLREAPEGWFLYAPADSPPPPEAPLSSEDFLDFLQEAEDFLRKMQRADYCGAVYVDDREAPHFVKIFHPRNMGSSCGCGGPILPKWTLSRMRPETLPTAQDTPPRQRSLFRGLFSS